MEPLLTLEQAGTLLGLTRSQMFELTRERSQARRKVRLPIVRIGKRCLIRRESLQRWVEAMEQGDQR
jgi:excisionase family DNA binding protein